MSDSEVWRNAYARQAAADWRAYDVLRRSFGLPRCQSFHFLQMSCEKLCKAFLCGRGVNPRLLQTSHGYIAKNLPLIFQLEPERLKPHPLRSRSTLLKQIKNLSREIELLAPTVDSQRRPDNCEYPWEDAAGNVVVPAEHSFATLSLLSQPAGQELLKILPLAIDALL